MDGVVGGGQSNDEGKGEDGNHREPVVDEAYTTLRRGVGKFPSQVGPGLQQSKFPQPPPCHHLAIEPF